MQIVVEKIGGRWAVLVGAAKCWIGEGLEAEEEAQIVREWLLSGGLQDIVDEVAEKFPRNLQVEDVFPS